VADLVNGIVYVYFFYQYDRPLVLNVRQELANPREPGPLSMLFPQDVRDEAARRYNRARLNIVVSKVAGIAWPALVILSLILFFADCTEPSKGFRFWLPAVIILGPVALAVRYLVKRKYIKDTIGIALTETLGSIVPVVLSYTTGLSILIVNTISGTVPETTQLLLMIVFPLVVGWIYHLVLLTSLSSSTGLFIFQRLPQVLITTFLGLGGMIPVAMPLVNKTINMSLLIPLSPLAVTGWWGMVSVSALAGGILVFLFELQEARKGSRSWTVLAREEDQLIIPPFRRIWWWIPISFVILIAGLALGVMLLE